jgi:hypothetical protein
MVGDNPMDISCLSRGGFHCASKSCPFETTHQNCVLNVIISKLNGYRFGYRFNELLDILLDKIDMDDGYKEARIEAGFSLSESTEKPKFLFAVKLEDTRKALEAFNFPNFIYFRPSKLTFIDVDGGSHGQFMVLLYWLGKLSDKTANVNTLELFNSGGRKAFSLPDYAEKFITEGYGFFSSSVYKGLGIPRWNGYPIIYSSNHKITFQEKKIFDGYGYDPLNGDDDFDD